MKIRKLLALLAALAILFTFSSCDWFTKNPDDNNTTTAADRTEPTGPDDIPPASDAVMAPVQGGPMLYTFRGREAYAMQYSEYDGEEYPVYPIGLVDQNGKPVSAPVYHNADYIYDEAEQRVIGLAAVKGREITLYELNGTSRVLPVEGYRIEVYPGGRYATVYTAEGMTWTGEENAGDPMRDGIYDLKNNKFAVEPRDNQQLNYKKGGVVMGYQSNSNGKETAQWAFLLTDESLIEFPLELGRIQDYYPETGWFGGISVPDDYEQRVYDRDLRIIPALTGWSVDSEGFRGGQWCMIYNNNAFPGVSTWVDREGVLSDKRYAEVQANAGGKSYSISKDGSTIALLDADLNQVFALGAGERFARLQTMGDNMRDEGFLHLNRDGSVKAVYDLAARPMQAAGAFRCWGCFAYDVVENGAYTLYAAKDGQWTVLDLGQYQPHGQAEDSDTVPYANPIVVCEDYIVVETGVHWWDGGIEYNTFAVDWQGEFADSCPLEPFIVRGILTPFTAGPQGPNYYWIEQQEGEQQEAKRGYINLKGEWLFVDEG